MKTVKEVIDYLNKNKGYNDYELHYQYPYFEPHFYLFEDCEGFTVEFFETRVLICKGWDSVNTEYKDEPLALDLYNMLMEREPKISGVYKADTNKIRQNIILRSI